MGWTFEHRTPKKQTNLQFFAERYKSVTDTVLDVATKKQVAYIALHVEPLDGSPSYVTALIVPTRWVRGEEWCNFGVKEMTESMGPVEAECPQRILEQLSPVEDCWGPVTPDSSAAHAQDWRDRCWQAIRASRARPKIKVGDLVRFAAPLNFSSGDSEQLFRFQGGSTFTDRYGRRRFHITNWRRLSHEVNPEIPARPEPQVGRLIDETEMRSKLNKRQAEDFAAQWNEHAGPQAWYGIRQAENGTWLVFQRQYELTTQQVQQLRAQNA